MEDRTFDWNESIPDVSKDEYKPLKPGVYQFEVKRTERGVWPDTAKKLHGAKKMDIVCRVWNEDGSGEAVGTITLHSSVAYKIRQLFRSIGCIVEHGKDYTPEWNRLQGASGRCTVKVRSWTGRDGKEYLSNDIDEWLEPVLADTDNGAEMSPF